jgi:hypothetical protein
MRVNEDKLFPSTQTAPAEGLTATEIEQWRDALIRCYTSLGTKVSDPALKSAYAKTPAYIHKLCDMALRSLAPHASKISIEFAQGIVAADNASGEGFYTRACVCVAKELLRIAQESDDQRASAQMEISGGPTSATSN